MIHHQASSSVRTLKSVTLNADLVVAGGGVAGLCAAVTAARAGIRVVLVQDRPVLGGNASSEVRLWMLGATSHMGNNNRWAREGGVVDEILVENLYRNPEGNPLILDTTLLEKARGERNITLLLNTAVDSVEKSSDSVIGAVTAFCSQNQTRYRLEAPLYCDASGDGIIAFLAGAPFRMGAESRDEFDEGFAPETSYGELLGHSLYFYSKDVGRPVRYVAPDFALKDITQIPRYREVRASDSGCRFWWFEYGGRMDTIHDTEEIKWELWKVVYGVWDYIKNSGKFPEAETLTLEWVGTIPGKRESRRFEGDFMLSQRDLVEQRTHPDAVSFGGWAMDLHPAEGVYSELSPCTQWHSKGVYQIPYRCLYSRSIDNLFLGGRIMSASHVAFGSTRVMATCGHNAQAIGIAAALCRQSGLLPRELLEPGRMHQLQQKLLRSGQYIPGLALDLDAGSVSATASSRLILRELTADGDTLPLHVSRAMLLPVPAGKLPAATFLVDVEAPTVVELEVRGSSIPGNFTPDVVLHRETLRLNAASGQPATIRPDVSIQHPAYVTYCLLCNPAVRVHTSAFRATGILSLAQSMNKAVAKGARQEPPPGSGIDSFEFWLPGRRPEGRNLAIVIDPPLDVFGADNVQNGIARPTTQPNAWVADAADPSPRISVCWGVPRDIRRIELSFDTDFDHPMESVLMGHPEREIPFCVKRYRITTDRGHVLFECPENHQTRNVIVLPERVTTTAIHMEILETRGAPAAVFEVRCYED
jgi:hypothetical protein